MVTPIVFENFLLDPDTLRTFPQRFSLLQCHSKHLRFEVDGETDDTTFFSMYIEAQIFLKSESALESVDIIDYGFNPTCKPSFTFDFEFLRVAPQLKSFRWIHPNPSYDAVVLMPPTSSGIVRPRVTGELAEMEATHHSQIKFGFLRNLECLTLCSNILNGTTNIWLRDCIPKLRKLKITSSHIFASIIHPPDFLEWFLVQFEDSLEDLTVTWMWGTLPQFRKLRRLECIVPVEDEPDCPTLSETWISYPSSLKSITLHYCSITKEVVDSTADLRLESLHLAGCPIMPVPFKNFVEASVKSLQTFTLEGNIKICDISEILETFKSNPSLEFISKVADSLPLWEHFSRSQSSTQQFGLIYVELSSKLLEKINGQTFFLNTDNLVLALAKDLKTVDILDLIKNIVSNSTNLENLVLCYPDMDDASLAIEVLAELETRLSTLGIRGATCSKWDEEEWEYWRVKDSLREKREKRNPP